MPFDNAESLRIQDEAATLAGMLPGAHIQNPRSLRPNPLHPKYEILWESAGYDFSLEGHTREEILAGAQELWKENHLTDEAYMEMEDYAEQEEAEELSHMVDRVLEATETWMRRIQEEEQV